MPSFDFTQTQVYFRDNFVPFAEANLSITSSPILYGLCVYTVCGAAWNPKTKQLQLFRIKDHYQRLLGSAKIMDFHSFEQEWPQERFAQMIVELLQRNHIQEDVLVRASVFIDELAAGTHIHDLKNSLSAYVQPMGQVFPKDGIHACVSSWQRTADNAIPSRAKVNGSYANASLMKNEALLNGYDEAIAVDDRGHVAEGTIANIFLVREDTLITPDRATDILEGITRDTVIRLAEHLQIPVVERSIDRSELYLADEIFISGSSANILPVLSVDRRPVNGQKSGVITKRIMAELKKIQRGQNQTFADWLTLVS